MFRLGGGDFNIYYVNDSDTIYRSSHAMSDDYSDIDTDHFPISELWKTFERRKDVVAVAHVGGRA